MIIKNQKSIMSYLFAIIAIQYSIGVVHVSACMRDVMNMGDQRRWDSLTPRDQQLVKFIVSDKWADNNIDKLNKVARPNLDDRKRVLQVFRSFAHDESYGRTNWKILLMWEKNTFITSVGSTITDLIKARRDHTYPFYQTLRIYEDELDRREREERDRRARIEREERERQAKVELAERVMKINSQNPNHPKAIFNAARLHEHGIGVTKDWRMAEQHYARLANSGHVNAQFNLSLLYNEGGYGLAKNADKSFHYLKLAADNGHLQAQCNLGIAFLRSSGDRAQLDRMGAYYLKLAADKGDAKAQYNLGKLNILNRGVGGRNDAEAVRLYRLAASQGHAAAQRELQQMCSANHHLKPYPSDCNDYGRS